MAPMLDKGRVIDSISVAWFPPRCLVSLSNLAGHFDDQRQPRGVFSLQRLVIRTTISKIRGYSGKTLFGPTWMLTAFPSVATNLSKPRNPNFPSKIGRRQHLLQPQTRQNLGILQRKAHRHLCRPRRLHSSLPHPTRPFVCQECRRHEEKGD